MCLHFVAALPSLQENEIIEQNSVAISFICVIDESYLKGRVLIFRN